MTEPRCLMTKQTRVALSINVLYVKYSPCKWIRPASLLLLTHLFGLGWSQFPPTSYLHQLYPAVFSAGFVLAVLYAPQAADSVCN